MRLRDRNEKHRGCHPLPNRASRAPAPTVIVIVGLSRDAAPLNVAGCFAQARVSVPILGTATERNDGAVILEFPHAFPADGAEHRVPDVAAGQALLGAQAAPLEALFARRRAQWAELLETDIDRALLDRTENAVRLAYARLALRHGHLGNDFHAYHNEGHILEICGARIDRVVAACGLAAMPLRDWCALMLFGAGHDLRQREASQLVAGIGANERASIAETHRILAVCGSRPNAIRISISPRN